MVNVRRPSTLHTLQTTSPSTVASTTSASEDGGTAGPTPTALHTPLGPTPDVVDDAALVTQALQWQDGGLSAEGKREKHDRLSSSVFSFFRGTARLYFARTTPRDRSLPRPLLCGDPHPENFGVMQGNDGKLVFGLNDFDEAKPGPFTWDVSRAMTGLALAAAEHGLSPDAADKALRSFAKRYVKTLRAHAKDASDDGRITEKNAPRVVQDLLTSTAKTRSRKKFLKKLVSDGQFKETDELKRAPHLRASVEAALQTYASKRDEGDAFFKVKDIAVKSGSGTASLGKTRMWVLVEGKGDKDKNDVVLELKPSSTSVLQGLTPMTALDAQLHQQGVQRVVQAEDVHLADSNPFYGHVDVDGVDHLVRERSPFKARVDLAAFDGDDLKSYAKGMAEALAMAHARSDADGGLRGDSMEGQILHAIDQQGGKDAFVDVMVDRAQQDAQQVAADWATFKQLNANGQL